jgi:CheY-like chemotaxis protein/HPt (histidine-containing phosphotransfer) domain-containing protein
LAEDNAVSQRVAVVMLEMLGFRVDVVADGAEAVRAASARRYQAILMDCQIPVLDGYRATSEIRRQQGRSSRTPVIAVTASPNSDQARCFTAGMDDYVSKPLSLKALAAVLGRWVPNGSDMTVDADPGPPNRDVLDHRSDSEPQVLDERIRDRLERLGRSLGEDLIGQLATLFLAEAEGRMAAMRRDLTTGDLAAVAVSAHTLRGASANLGATDLAELCARLADESAARERAESCRLLDAVAAELVRVRSALESPHPIP